MGELFKLCMITKEGDLYKYRFKWRTSWYVGSGIFLDLVEKKARADILTINRRRRQEANIKRYKDRLPG